MTRTFLKKKFTLKKKCLWSGTKVYTDSSSIKGDSAIIKIHPTTINFPQKRKNSGHTRLFIVNPRMYADIVVKAACIHDCELKTRVHEEKCIKRKANR